LGENLRNLHRQKMGGRVREGLTPNHLHSSSGAWGEKGMVFQSRPNIDRRLIESPRRGLTEVKRSLVWFSERLNIWEDGVKGIDSNDQEQAHATKKGLKEKKIDLKTTEKEMVTWGALFYSGRVWGC